MQNENDNSKVIVAATGIKTKGLGIADHIEDGLATGIRDDYPQHELSDSQEAQDQSQHL